ncbi:MAG: winged helix-turn-helix domain-containing protein [Pseudomonadota bacterium]
MAAASLPVYRFEDFELDPAKFELRRSGSKVAVEPQVFSLLVYLAEHRDRLISKDELIEAIWHGRIVSEAAIAARIKAARKALDDDGTSQRLIRTVHGHGFRFVGAVASADQIAVRPASEHPGEIERHPPIERDGRPSIAVLPFTVSGDAGPYGIIADALPSDVIMDLARLNWLMVIARGSSFQFREPDADPHVIGRALAVRYCLSGVIDVLGEAVTVSVMLADTGTGETIWAEHYRSALSELQQMRPEIEASVVAALEVQIPRNEVRLARRRPAAELDAWASFHLGLDRVYTFTQSGNADAQDLFAQALMSDPHFSRAMGGLSFTHFQNAFLGYAEAGNRARELDAARHYAQRAVEADRLDPFAHFNAGRSHWINGEVDQAIEWFGRATALSPSYAQGVYTRGLTRALVGEASAADEDLALALDLSPLDPLAYAMVSSRAFAHIHLQDYERAADYGAKAARMPGAHKHVKVIGALSAQLAERVTDAQRLLSEAKAIDPQLSADDFFRAFPFAETGGREAIERTLKELGL